MKSNYDILGNHIRLIDTRNRESITDRVLGINIDKFFMPSVANVIGTDLSKYKLITKGKFACNPMHVGRDERLPVALYDEEEPAIVSPAYFMFEVIDNSILNEDYLMMWFRRPEFDRICWLHTDGSVRGGITWDDICRLELPIPPIENQLEIVNIYKAITERIALKQKINDNLEETAQSLFQEQFAAFYNENELPDGYSIATLDSLCSIKGGKRLPADGELLDTPTAHPYIRVRDLGSNRYVCLTNQFQYIDEETHSAISRYIVNTNDIVISIVGTIGLIGKIHTSLNNANLTENCVKLANIHTVTPDYLYYTLCYKKQIKEIELLTVGAVQSKLPMYNIQSMKILVPPAEVIEDFQHKFDIFNEQIEANTIEIQRLYELQSVLLAKLAY
ncbi:restriction endonuclease subunit S [[Clostridium] innocuum]|jgi:type I restriction enzyme S subunit|uniref:restriction endonuclease subunit S n=1 Tax=Catenibacterium mitsuokai TaxID=100886 RepID=UPI002147B405|nr:restriction endonuclease subunit S [Catenibacterium tridentinum]MCR0528068.1 restriction endonuclease subunit S [[Clostridium] innocuum]